MLHITRLKAWKGGDPDAYWRETCRSVQAGAETAGTLCARLKTSTHPKSQFCQKQHKFVLGLLKAKHTNTASVSARDFWNSGEGR